MTDRKKRGSLAHSEVHEHGSSFGDFLRHAIFGMNDGLVSTLAFVAGLVGASMGKGNILLGGLIVMFSGAISMSLGTYISTKSQSEFYSDREEKEKNKIKHTVKQEKAHLKEIYRAKGFRGKELDRIVNHIASDKNVLSATLLSEEKGRRKNTVENPVVASAIMFIAFVLGSLVPLAAFTFSSISYALKSAILWSIVLMILVGIIKTRYTGKNWFHSAFEMVFIAAAATFFSFYFGSILTNILPGLV